MYVQNQTGKWDPYLRVSYDGERWRTEGIATPKKSVIVIFRDGLLYEDRRSQNVGVLRSATDADEFLRPPSRGEALEIIQQQLKSTIGRATELSLAPSADVAGRPVYKVVFHNKERERDGELIVNKDSDLPISAETWGGHPNQRVRWAYHFNVSFPIGFFEPSASKTFVDLRKTIPAREALWGRPIASVKGAKVLDACVTTNGTAWLAVRNDPGISGFLMPVNFKGLPGVTYARPRSTDRELG